MDSEQYQPPGVYLEAKIAGLNQNVRETIYMFLNSKGVHNFKKPQDAIALYRDALQLIGQMATSVPKGVDSTQFVRMIETTIEALQKAFLYGRQEGLDALSENPLIGREKLEKVAKDNLGKPIGPYQAPGKKVLLLSPKQQEQMESHAQIVGNDINDIMEQCGTMPENARASVVHSLQLVSELMNANKWGIDFRAKRQAVGKNVPYEDNVVEGIHAAMEGLRAATRGSEQETAKNPDIFAQAIATVHRPPKGISLASKKR